MYAASIIYFAYLGFDFITALSPEAKSPKKSVPKAVKLSNIVATILYVLTAISVYGMAPLHEFDADTAMAESFSFVGLDWVSIIIYFCAFFGITAACFGAILVSSLFLPLSSIDH